MTCFCDIPLSRITEHTQFYGKYGIGMTKEWGLKNGLNPVVYFPPDGHIPKLANYLMQSEFEEDEKEAELNSHSFRLLKLMKPIRGKMLVNGQPVEKDFYQESEWRYAPDINYLLYEEDFDEGKEDANKDAEAHKISFAPADVRYIFVPDDSDIPALCDFINNHLAAYPLADLKILQTRIVSLAQMEADV